jgi:protein gp37
MSANSKIEWCDHTFNPWWGCTKVSPGCEHCYADAFSHRLGKKLWGKGVLRERTSENVWSQPLKWNEQAKKNGMRPRVFCASMADWLDDEVPVEWLADLLKLIHATPNLDWLLLTKRPQNWRTRIVEAWASITTDLDEAGRDPFSLWLSRWNAGYAPKNIWIGTTVEDQKRADQRISVLLRIPAKVHFLSCEPLLGPIKFGTYSLKTKSCFVCKAEDELKQPRGTQSHPINCVHRLKFKESSSPAIGINWVICGGESGPKARPMHPDWARALRDQCEAAGVPFFFKQWGCFRPAEQADFEPGAPGKMGWVRADGSTYWADAPQSEGDELMLLTSKVQAGRLLDGVEHNEFPEISK